MATAKKVKQLTGKQQLFCEEYLTDLNARQAAIRAGYAKASAMNAATHLLKNPLVHAHLSSLMDTRSERTHVDADFVVHNLVEVYRRCMESTPVLRWDASERCMKETGEYKFDSTGATKALELLGRHLAMFTDKKDIGPVTISWNEERSA